MRRRLRARLSPVVGLDDAQRAIHIMESFLKRVTAFEGKLDIDVVATGVSHRQRERKTPMTLGTPKPAAKHGRWFSWNP